ncbi:Protein of unknown function [Klenkia soli]|uniref:DUF559 domain-containing protein n=1 Tax=Klenkia soli TaxID=1052260 RepID=A0A1H0HS39_9ACTN|nr:DUF559 domain-containing protein [Klenkia soli]SDO21953.1 Protein of unknown function [Klenkia soli]
MPPVPRCPPELRAVVFRGSTAIRDGQVTAGQLRSHAFTSLARDVYAGPDVVLDHRARITAVRLLLPSAVVSGRSAAVVWGVPLAEPRDDVEVTLPPACTAGRVDGVRARRRVLPAADVVLRGDAAVTDLARTALDLAGCAPRDDAVALVDRFLGAVPLSHDELLVAAVADRTRGARRAEAVVRLADGLAESPMETVVRLLLHRSRLPTPVAQFRVVHDGREIARVDFAWPDRKVAVEYDGRWHGEPGQFARDRTRLNRLTAAGWRVVFVTAEDLRNPSALVARVAAELARSM